MSAYSINPQPINSLGSSDTSRNLGGTGRFACKHLTSTDSHPGKKKIIPK